MNFIHTIDSVIYNTIFSCNSITVTNMMLVITNLASALSFIIIVILSFILFKEKKESKYILLNLVMVFLLNSVIKIIVARPRPNILRIVEEFGYSFPSAHSMISIAFYGFIMYLINTNINIKRKIKYIVNVLFTFLILLIGISRIYLGVHYATDIFGGFFIGAIYLVIFIQFIWKKREQ